MSNPSENVEGTTQAARPQSTGLTSRPTNTGTSSDVQPVKVVPLVPAHNEEEQIAATIESLLAQTMPVQVVISADNCTDRTVEIASFYQGVIVAETVDNTGKRAGALNQAWDRYARHAHFVFTMDADTTIPPDCIQRLSEGIGDHGGVGVWPGLKANTSTSLMHRLLYRMVRLEYGAVERLHRRRMGTVENIAGMGGLYRGDALLQVAEVQGFPWNAKAIAEDLRLTILLRQAGWSVAAVEGAFAFTDAVADPAPALGSAQALGGRGVAGAAAPRLDARDPPSVGQHLVDPGLAGYATALGRPVGDLPVRDPRPRLQVSMAADHPPVGGAADAASVWYNTSRREQERSPVVAWGSAHGGLFPPPSGDGRVDIDSRLAPQGGRLVKNLIHRGGE